MVFSVSPSVTVREVDASAVIPAISNSPAAIAGVFGWGPEEERVLITSEKELARIFGKPKNYTNSLTATTWSNQETFFVSADYLSYSNALYVTRVSSNAVTAKEEDVTKQQFEAKYNGSIGNSISVSIITGADAYKNEFISSLNGLEGTIPFGSTSISITTDQDFVNQGANEIQANDIIRIGNKNVGFQDLVVTSISDVENSIDPTLTDYTIAFATKYRLPEESISNLSFTRLGNGSGVVDGAPENGTFHVIVFDSLGEITGTAGTVLEIYENLSTNSSAKLDDGTSKFYDTVIDTQSDWIKKGTENVDLNVDANKNIYLNFANGDDGDDESAVSLGSLAVGYDLYKEPDEIDISFLLAGKSNNTNLANYLISNIAEYRKDCVVYISPQKTDVVDGAMITDTGNNYIKMNNVIEFRNALQNSSYWFMDSGYKYRYDRYNDVYCWVPLNGDMGGLSARALAWESPAGYKRGIIKNVVRLAFNPNKPQRDQLYGKDINPVITQAGQGTLLFGDKTGLGRASAFNRINVRRLFITVEKAIATVSASFLFDFNDEYTQTQFKNLVEPFLRDIQGKRGIIDFRVISDATVNTPDVIDQNIFKSSIFIKPAKSINNIELTFVATRTGVEFEEIVGQQF